MTAEDPPAIKWVPKCAEQAKALASGATVLVSLIESGLPLSRVIESFEEVRSRLEMLQFTLAQTPRGPLDLPPAAKQFIRLVTTDPEGISRETIARHLAGVEWPRWTQMTFAERGALVSEFVDFFDRNKF